MDTRRTRSETTAGKPAAVSPINPVPHGVRDEKGIRLNVYVAGAGGCSRREADRLISEGRVTVDGRTGVPGQKIHAGNVVALNGKTLIPAGGKTVAAFYKPAGVTCTASDPHAQKTLADAFHFEKRLTYAGRLDKDSEGLLLMTDDGALIEAAMRGGSGHEKEYLVRTDRPVTDGQLARLSEGLFLSDLGRHTLPCRVIRTGDKSFRIILTQGLNRQIRRMCRAVGLRVVRLKRIRVLNIELGSLQPGAYRLIEGKEKEDLYRLAGLV